MFKKAVLIFEFAKKKREIYQNNFKIVFDSSIFYGLYHELRTPNEAFFHQNPKLLGLGRQIGQVHFGAFWVFSADLSAPILVL